MFLYFYLNRSFERLYYKLQIYKFFAKFFLLKKTIKKKFKKKKKWLKYNYKYFYNNRSILWKNQWKYIYYRYNKNVNSLHYWDLKPEFKSKPLLKIKFFVYNNLFFFKKFNKKKKYYIMFCQYLIFLLNKNYFIRYKFISKRFKLKLLKLWYQSKFLNYWLNWKKKKNVWIF